MAQKITTCRLCQESFVLRPGKPGYIDVCEDCTDLDEVLEYPAAAQSNDEDGIDFQITTRGQLERMKASRLPEER